MFSVVVPLYNKEKSIPHTIRSILSQTYSNFELIIINDGSTDLSRKRAASFTDPRIQIIDQQNLGVSAARNRGINAASYPYIAFMDGDDLWEPQYLQTQIELIQDFPQAGMWSCGAGLLVEHEKRPFYHGLPEGYRGLISNYFTIDKIGMLFRPSGTVVHRSVFEDVGLFDERIHFGEDLDMLYRILFRYHPAFFNKNVLFYRVDAENNILGKEKPIEKRFFYFIDKYQKHRNGSEEFRKYFDRLVLAFMFEHRLNNEYNSTVNKILKKIDFSLQSSKWRLVYAFPSLYKFYRQHIKKRK